MCKVTGPAQLIHQLSGSSGHLFLVKIEAVRKEKLCFAWALHSGRGGRNRSSQFCFTCGSLHSRDTQSSCRHHVISNWQVTACANSPSVKTAKFTSFKAPQIIPQANGTAPVKRKLLPVLPLIFTLLCASCCTVKGTTQSSMNCQNIPWFPLLPPSKQSIAPTMKGSRPLQHVPPLSHYSQTSPLLSKHHLS